MSKPIFQAKLGTQ